MKKRTIKKRSKRGRKARVGTLTSPQRIAGYLRAAKFSTGASKSHDSQKNASARKRLNQLIRRGKAPARPPRPMPTDADIVRGRKNAGIDSDGVYSNRRFY